MIKTEGKMQPPPANPSDTVATTIDGSEQASADVTMRRRRKKRCSLFTEDGLHASSPVVRRKRRGKRPRFLPGERRAYIAEAGGSILTRYSMRSVKAFGETFGKPCTVPFRSTRK